MFSTGMECAGDYIIRWFDKKKNKSQRLEVNLLKKKSVSKE